MIIKSRNCVLITFILQISCEATLMESINRDCIFENNYLGRMILRNMNRRVEEMMKGTVCRVVCRRTSSYESMCSILPFVMFCIDIYSC